MGNAGWIAALIFCACAAIRLARFNVESVRDEGATKGNPYFTGLPTPAAACMMLLPLLISFQWNDSVVREPWVSGIFIAITSVLMVSRLPDAVHQIHEAAAPASRIWRALAFAVLAALLIAWPWATLTVGLLIYVASIPFAMFAHHPRYATKQAS